MNKSLVLLTIVIVAVATIPAGLAQAAPVGIGIGVHGGYGESKDADSGSGIAGVNVVLNVLPFLGVVGMVDYKFEEDFTENGEDYTVKSYPLSAMARLYFPMTGLSPYVAAGVQYRLLKYGGKLFEDYDIDDSENSFGWIAGAGAELRPGQSFEFFGEVRYESVDADRDIENAIDDAEDFSYDQWSVRGGITFFLN